MRIIFFEGHDSKLHWGCDPHDGQAYVLDGGPYTSFERSGQRLPVKRLLAPIQPTVILGIGLNYKRHALETGQPIPRVPVVFGKNPASVTGPEQPIKLHPCCMQPPQVDYEVELAVVLGKVCKDATAQNALDHVLGYTVGNDVSARRWQKKTGGQWTKGKSFDSFCPLGPCLVTPDELPDPQRLALSTRLNGELMQSSNTEDMIFTVKELICYLSEGTTLWPGTVIMTGTPEGVGFVRQPRVFLMPGDVVELEIEGIGVLRNPVEAI